MISSYSSVITYLTSLAFDGKSVKDRNQAVTDSKAQFGEKFIIFPNPMYGDWEGALYDYNFKNQMQKKIKSVMTT